MNPTLIYCYDAYCGWCYGFSPVIKKLWLEYRASINFEVLSGGMVLPAQPVHIGAMASYIQKAYKTVENITGVRFGADYLWHINNANQSDWYPHSEKPAIALCVFKDDYPDLQISFAADLQYALHAEGRDLCDDEAYRHLMVRYNVATHDFYAKLHSQAYKEKAYHEFGVVKQLKVSGYPCVLLQGSASKFYQLAVGYTPYDTLKKNLEVALNDLASPKS